MMDTELESDALFKSVTFSEPRNCLFLSSGAMQVTLMVTGPSFGVRLCPDDGVTVHVPQVKDEVLTVQLSVEVGSP